jgi:hypothetical protein
MPDQNASSFDTSRSNLGSGFSGFSGIEHGSVFVNLSVHDLHAMKHAAYAIDGVLELLGSGSRHGARLGMVVWACVSVCIFILPRKPVLRYKKKCVIKSLYVITRSSANEAQQLQQVAFGRSTHALPCYLTSRGAWLRLVGYSPLPKTNMSPR